MQFELLTCPICYNELNQANHLPRIISNCGHTVCSNCLSIILNQETPRCPLDKKALHLHGQLESFPVNFFLTQLLEGKVEKDLCKEHHEETRFVCLTDKCKICDDCICTGIHKSHEIQSMKKVKCEADSKRKVLENLLEKLDTSRQEIDGALEGKRASMVKSIKDRFEELRWILGNKEQQLIFEVNSYFAIEREKTNSLIGNGSVLRDDIVSRVSELANIFKEEGYLKTDDYFDKVEDTIQQLTSKVNFNVIREHTQELGKGLEKMCVSFDAAVKSYTESCILIEIPFVNFSDSLLKVLSDDENANDQYWQFNNKLSTIKTRSVLNFEYNENHLEILVESRNPKEVFLDVEKWKKVKEVKLDLKQYVLTDEDFRILVYLWKKLNNVVSFSLKFNPMGVSDNELISVFKTIIGGAMKFEKADIDLEHCQITDKSMVFLLEKVLAKKVDLTSLNINLNSTPVTGKTIEAITKNIILNTKNLESFQLFLTSTCMTDETISKLFTGMPSAKHFSLSLSGTSISDRSIETLTKNTLPTLKSLENFEIYLHTTKVTDASVENIIPVLKKVKKLSLDFGCTDITDRSVDLLSKAIVSARDNIEEFALSVGGTKVTDQSVIRIFTAMPRVKSFLLGLFDTEITDKSIEAFIKNTLTSMKALESFEMWLRDTEVTDSSLEHMFGNMKEVKKFSLDLQGTKVTDKIVEKLFRENILKIGVVEEFKMNIANTKISERFRAQIEDFGKKLGK